MCLLSSNQQDRIIEAYKLFQQTYPKKKFSALLPLSQWMKTLWMPNVRLAKKLKPRTLKTLSVMSNASATGGESSLSTTSSSTNPGTKKKTNKKVSPHIAETLRSTTASPTSRMPLSAKLISSTQDTITKKDNINPKIASSPSKKTKGKNKMKVKGTRNAHSANASTVPVTTGGSILDINNSEILKPESVDHLSKNSYDSSILNKQSPKRELPSDASIIHSRLTSTSNNSPPTAKTLRSSTRTRTRMRVTNTTNHRQTTTVNTPATT